MVETGREMDVGLLGVTMGAVTLALTLLFPGTVMDSLLVAMLNLFGSGWLHWSRSVACSWPTV